ncbi:hypothetical protein G4B88_014229 [Cannabis sativa]|uniref:Uncharacterized protein n=1 Tax=Cannabis sativa TaxID=3483 RepID=A0A7J6EWU6_CANSA|nr:hypothetical protein G4B88_014229 [Cannabis sativa]
MASRYLEKVEATADAGFSKTFFAKSVLTLAFPKEKNLSPTPALEGDEGIRVNTALDEPGTPIREKRGGAGAEWCARLSESRNKEAAVVPGFGEEGFAMELELSTAEGLLSMMAVAVLATNGEKDLTNADSGTHALRFPESTSHSCLEPISSSARKHLVNTQNMERVHPHPQMESIFSGKLSHTRKILLRLILPEEQNFQ